MTRGTIVWVNLEDASPPEFEKIRPGLVLSNTRQNIILDTVVVLPVSTRPPEIWPLRLRIPLKHQKNHFVVVPGIRQVSKKRLIEILAEAPESFMRKVEEAVALYLGA